ncbi:hypothetical protein ACWECW_18540 [Rhodococcus ruber]
MNRTGATISLAIDPMMSTTTVRAITAGALFAAADGPGLIDRLGRSRL